ncbi:hypothetical protein M8J75_004364 [Diaphorina citri]|nr:hypothetical protein M8J75_004364 [Diaphorina citri]
MNCNHCKNELPEEGDEARCSMCKHGYHFECTTISESSWKTLTKAKKLDWKCHVCRNSLKLPLTTRSGATSSPSQETQRDPTMIAMQNLWKADFAKFTATLGGKLDEYEKSLEFTAGKMDDIAKDIKVIQQKMIETEQKQNKIEAENKELKTRVRNLEVELKEMGQVALNNKLEISGLPNSANLNVTDVAKKFVEKTGLDPIAVGNYTVEKPLKTQNQDRPNVKASIVVGFKSVETRNQVFETNITEEEAECYVIQQFNRISLCRKSKKGGGVMIFYRGNTYLTETLHYNFDESETLAVQMKHLKTKTMFKLLAIYRPPKSNQKMFVQDLTWWLKHAAKKDDNIIMVGDLNICTLKRSSVNADYINMLSNYLFLPVIHTATREEMRDETLTTSCVDHINIKLEKSLKISSSVIMEKPADHWFIGCRVTKNGAPLPQEEKKTTIIETVNSRKVQQEIELTSWDNFKHIEDPEEMYRSIVSTFNNIYEKSKRVYEKGEKDFQTPWVNQELRTEIHKKMTLLKQWRNRLLVYFLYGIHHSKEQEVTSSYKVLLTSNEAVKLRWGAIPPRRRTKSPDDDTRPIVDSD